MSYSTETQKIDKAPVDGLSGVVDSLAYKVHEIEKHLHNTSQWYGLTGNTLERKGNTVISLTGGNTVWGTEIQIHDGAVIESGSGTKKFDLHEVAVTSVGNANRPTYIEFYYGTRATGVVCTFTNATSKVNKVAHGLVNDTKIMFSTDTALPTGLDANTVYYVINKADDDFEVSLTPSPGSAETFSDDGSGTNNYHVLTQTLLSELLVSASATNADAQPYTLRSLRQICSSRIWARAKSTTGGTNVIAFFLGIHTYIA